jgi:hypothetical protein
MIYTLALAHEALPFVPCSLRTNRSLDNFSTNFLQLEQVLIPALIGRKLCAKIIQTPPFCFFILPS